MVKYCILLFASLFIIINTFCQTFITEVDAIGLTIKNSKNLIASDLAIKQQKQLLKASINLPNPEVFIESPTGNFYTTSITQTIEFPTVYKNQKQVQKQRIGLAEKEKELSIAEISYQVKQLYLSLQYADTLQKQLYMQDTVYERISKSASRQFDAGQIDYLQKLFTETQYGEIHNQYLQAQISLKNLQNQLRFITGFKGDFSISPFFIANDNIMIGINENFAFTTNPSLQLYKQTELIGQKNIELQKSKSMPGLAFGYFNQGERSTLFANRFRFGFTVPLWFGQYQSNISAAKTELVLIQQKTSGLQQQLSLQLIQAQNEWLTNQQSVYYYQNTGIKKANEIIATAKRLLESGEIDYVNYLRNINDAYAIKLKYLEAVKNYNQSLLSIKYLTGTL